MDWRSDLDVERCVSWGRGRRFSKASEYIRNGGGSDVNTRGGRGGVVCIGTKGVLMVSGERSSGCEGRAEVEDV